MFLGVFLQRVKPNNPLTHAKCSSGIYNVRPSVQKAASHGKKCPKVRQAKPFSDITEQRSSLLPILISRRPSLHTVSPSDTFSIVVNTVWSRRLCLSCYLRRVRQTHRAAVQMPAREHVLSAWRPTSGCLLHLVFHYSFILRAGAASEARGAGQSRSRRGLKSHFPHGPSWHRFQAACISLEYHSSPYTFPAPWHAALGAIHSSHNTAFGFPCLPG